MTTRIATFVPVVIGYRRNGQPIYEIAGGAGAAFVAKNFTAGSAATRTQIQVLAATVRAKIRGFHVGNTAATAAQGVRFVLDRETTAGTAVTITAADTKLDLTGPSPITVATSTFSSTEPTTGVIVGDFGFDIVGTFIYWYPPGVEPFVVTTGRLGLSKTVGADTSLWAASLYWEE